MTSGDSNEPRIFTNQTIRLHDLADEGGYISNLLVQDCVVVGPAVAVWADIKVSNCTFAPGVEEVIWPISRNRPVVTGALMFRNCSFENSTFHGVGLAMHEDYVAEFIRTNLG